MRLKFLLFFLFVSSLNLMAQEFKSAVEYLNFIEKEQTTISKSTWKYTSAVAHSKSARRIDNTRKQLIKSIDAAKTKISNLKDGYKGDVEYRNQVTQFLDISKISINEEYGKLINMQEVAEQSYDAMEAYLLMRDLVNEKLDAENEKVENGFKSFALKYNITVGNGTSELSEKIKLSNEVFDYHTALYLIFFKANFTDISLSKAIENKDLNTIQQNANTLVQYADEGLEKLKTIKPYKGDSSVIMATKKLMEAKSAKDRTKEEIDSYNTLVKQVNKEIDNYNNANNTNVQEKNNIIDNWNNAGENFISSHVPID